MIRRRRGPWLSPTTFAHLCRYMILQDFLMGLSGYAAEVRAEEKTLYLRTRNFGSVMAVPHWGTAMTVVERDLQDVLVISNSRAFRIWFTVLLGVFVLWRVFLFVSIIIHRKNTTMQLGQSSVLAVFVLAGGFCIGSCHLLMPISDTHCLLREPFIFTSLTLMGNILMGRIWRISLVMSPVLNVGREVDETDKLKAYIMNLLTNLSDYEYLLGDFVRCRCKGGELERRRKRSSIRQKIPTHKLLSLIFLMLIPQLTLQICNLAVPQLQSSQQYNVLTPGVVEEACLHPVGKWDTWVGIVLVGIPYILGAFLTLSSDHLPSVFNESHSVKLSIRIFLLMLCIAGPAYVMAESPNAQTYLLSCCVFGITLPPCWFIVLSKLWSIWTGASNNLNVKHILRLSTTKLNTAGGVALDKNDDHGRSATLALTIGKMYEDMGMVQKSIAIFDDALALWMWDPNRNEKDMIGGYTVNEINAFTTHDLEYIINLKIAQGRVNGTFNSNENTGQKNAAQAWLDALEIYEHAPASMNMADRSIIFPIFSGLFVFLKGDKIDQDADCNFEQNLVRKFVRETKLHGDPIHYTRALAMQGEVKARLGKYEEALSSFEKLRAVYNPDEHSEGVSSAYGTDRSAQCYSQSAMWHDQLGHTNDALQMCEYVIHELFPKMDPKNVLNSCELLLPIIRISKNRGEEKRMRRLFDEHVVQNFHRHFGKDGVTPCLPIFRPMLLLLDVCTDGVNCPDFADGVEWLLEDEDNGVPPDFLDSVYTKLCWSPNSLVAELCLRLAKLVTDDQDRISLILKGGKLARRAEQKMKDEEGHVKLPIAYEMHEPVYADLKSMAVSYGIDLEAEIHSSVSNDSTSQIDPHHLPTYFLRHRRTASGRSLTGSKTSSNQSSPTGVTHTGSTRRLNSSGFMGSTGRFSSSARSSTSSPRQSTEEKEEQQMVNERAAAESAFTMTSVAEMHDEAEGGAEAFTHLVGESDGVPVEDQRPLSGHSDAYEIH